LTEFTFLGEISLNIQGLKQSAHTVSKAFHCWIKQNPTLLNIWRCW